MLVHMKDLFSRRVLLTTLAGVEDVHLDGDSIVGHWSPKTELALISNRTTKRGPLDIFMNINSDDQILRFTQRYGPLERPLEPAGSTFRQSLKGWRDCQADLRRLWSFGKSLGYKVGMREGDIVHFDRNGRVAGIELCSLRRFLEFEIESQPYRLLRVCARPGCGTYFIAMRKDSRLCGLRRCADFIRRERMRNWWSEHGKEWRKRRKKKMKKRRKA
jgi:hypothetical protein